MNCPHCGAASTASHYVNNPECDRTLKAVWGQRNVGKRKTRSSAGGRPFEPWDGVTNPHKYDISTPEEIRKYSKMKRCRVCKGPVLNRAKVRVCQACRGRKHF